MRNLKESDPSVVGAKYGWDSLEEVDVSEIVRSHSENPKKFWASIEAKQVTMELPVTRYQGLLLIDGSYNRVTGSDISTHY